MPERLSFLFVKNWIFKKNFNNALLTKIAVAMDRNLAVALSFMNFFQLSIVSFEKAQNYSAWKSNCFTRDFTAHCCPFYNNESKHFNEDFPALPKEDFQRHCNLVFDLNSQEDVAGQMHYPELSGGNLRLEMFLQFHLE